MILDVVCEHPIFNERTALFDRLSIARFRATVCFLGFSRRRMVSARVGILDIVSNFGCV